MTLSPASRQLTAPVVGARDGPPPEEEAGKVLEGWDQLLGADMPDFPPPPHEVARQRRPQYVPDLKLGGGRSKRWKGGGLGGRAQVGIEMD